MIASFLMCERTQREKRSASPTSVSPHSAALPDFRSSCFSYATSRYSQNFPWSATHSDASARSIAYRCSDRSGKWRNSKRICVPYFSRSGWVIVVCAVLQAGHWRSPYSMTEITESGLPFGCLLESAEMPVVSTQAARVRVRTTRERRRFIWDHSSKKVKGFQRVRGFQGPDGQESEVLGACVLPLDTWNLAD